MLVKLNKQMDDRRKHVRFKKMQMLKALTKTYKNEGRRTIYILDLT